MTNFICFWNDCPNDVKIASKLGSVQNPHQLKKYDQDPHPRDVYLQHCYQYPTE
jgi:hypothetical protein